MQLFFYILKLLFKLHKSVVPGIQTYLSGVSAAWMLQLSLHGCIHGGPGKVSLTPRYGLCALSLHYKITQTTQVLWYASQSAVETGGLHLIALTLKNADQLIVIPPAYYSRNLRESTFPVSRPD